jgi:hypothetical protein
MPTDEEMTHAVLPGFLVYHLVTFNEDDMSTFLSRFFNHGIVYSLVQGTVIGNAEEINCLEVKYKVISVCI